MVNKKTKKKAVEAVEGLDNTTRPIIHWSMYDLMKNADFKRAVFMSDDDTIKKLLYDVGVDTAFDFEWEDVLHRPRSIKQPWSGMRVKGIERTDDGWRRSGCASLEAYCWSKDQSLMNELLSLDPKSGRDCDDDYHCRVDIGVME